MQVARRLPRFKKMNKVTFNTLKNGKRRENVATRYRKWLVGGLMGWLVVVVVVMVGLFHMDRSLAKSI